MVWSKASKSGHVRHGGMTDRQNPQQKRMSTSSQPGRMGLGDASFPHSPMVQRNAYLPHPTRHRCVEAKTEEALTKPPSRSCDFRVALAPSVTRVTDGLLTGALLPGLSGPPPSPRESSPSKGSHHCHHSHCRFALGHNSNHSIMSLSLQFLVLSPVAP